MNIDELKKKKKLTQMDIEELLQSIGEPGENRQEKIDAVKQLNKSNFQGVQLERTLDSYRSF